MIENAEMPLLAVNFNAFRNMMSDGSIISEFLWYLFTSLVREYEQTPK